MDRLDLTALADRTLLVGFTEHDPPDWIRRAAPGLGGVVLYGRNLRSDADCARLAGILRSGDEVLVAVDEEGGDVTRLHYHAGSPTPGNHVLGAVDDTGATAAVAWAIGGELRAAGILLDLAPDADVNADPANPVVGVRSFGADPELVARHTAAWVRGLQAQGVAGCAKHFPGHGDTRTDSHLDLPSVTCSPLQWRRLHAPPFAAAIAAGVQSIMTAHIRYPAFDAVPATASHRILVDLLRHDLGFDGVVITDALDMAAISATYGPTAGAVAALAAGADALCLGSTGGEARYHQIRDAVVDAALAGTLPPRRLAEAAARVERLQAWTAAAAADGTSAPGDAAALTTCCTALAQRAAVAHRVRPIAGRPVVVELREAPNLAVGEAGWDLAAPLRDLGHPPVHTVRLSDPGGLDAVLARASGYPLIVVGRDVVRHAWQRAVWHAARAARPDTVLVDLGLPRPAELGDVPYLLVGGAARPNLSVAAALLVAGQQPE